MIDWYPTIKDYYNAKYYTDEDVKIFVVAGWITEEQYEQITGIEYVAA